MFWGGILEVLPFAHAPVFRNKLILPTRGIVTKRRRQDEFSPDAKKRVCPEEHTPKRPFRF
jgi:hypothetical protein